MTSTGWLGRLAQDAREGGEERLANVARFFEIVRRQAGLLRDDRLPFLVAQLDTLIEAGDDPSTADVDLDRGEAVHVLTYHKAKGLEFPIVHMVGLVDRFPTRSRGACCRCRQRWSGSRCRRATTTWRSGGSSTWA